MISNKMIEEANLENFNNVAKLLVFCDELMGERNVDKDSYEVSGFGELRADAYQNFEVWASNKERLYNAFGGKLKIKKPLKGEIIDESQVNNALNLFIKENHKELNPLIFIFLKRLTIGELSTNSISADIQFMDLEFKEGMRVSRCLGEICATSEEKEKAQTLFSSFVQSLKVDGNIVLSIDPVDIFTMSANGSNWSSCMHPLGCYGAGSLNYINDSVTAILYVETERALDITINEGEDDKAKATFSNKVWRRLVAFEEGFNYAVQFANYPNYSPIYNKEGTKLIEEVLYNATGKLIKTERRNRCDDVVDIVQPNEWALEGTPFYCDYHHNNLDEYYLTYTHDYENSDDLVYDIDYCNLSSIKNGYEAYCLCGCGEPSYMDCGFTEEADDYESFIGHF